MRVIIGSVGSVGSLRPRYDDQNDRVKGFVTGSDSSIKIAREQKSVKESIDHSYELVEENGASRVMLRTILEKGQAYEEYRGIEEEARVPLYNNFSGFDLVYLGRNFDSRETSQEKLEEEKKILEECLDRGNRKNFGRKVDGYEIGILSDPRRGDSEEVLSIMEEIYKRDGEVIMWYEPTVENIEEVLESSEAAVARRDGEIVSISMAERANFPTEIGDFTMYEISDAGTLPEHRNMGLNQACTSLLLEEISANDPESINVDARSSNIGINQSLVNNGFEYAGFIEKHVYIGGDRDVDLSGDLEDFNIFYYPLGGERDEY